MAIRSFNKKLPIFLLFFFLAAFLHAENRTGKVVRIIDGTAGFGISQVLFLSSNSDNIIDAVIFLYSGMKNFSRALIFSGYIKQGSTIVYNYDGKMVQSGIFFDSEGEGESIVSIDAISVNRMFR